MTTTNRIDSLDGLRGVAALIVVVHHSLLPTPDFAFIMLGVEPDGVVQWLLTYTPLRIVWAGTEAVWVFFVLSGFVLVRPYVSGRRLVIGRYYLRRFVRLYLPLFASYVFARALWYVPREADPTQTWWIAGHVPAAGITDSMRTMSLLFGNNITLNSVWWSLQWEVWFSILLPLVVFVVRRSRGNGVTLFVFFVSATAAGRLIAEDTTWHSVRLTKAPFYLSMFGVGAALTLLEAPLRRHLARVGGAGTVVFVTISITMLTMTASVEALTESEGSLHTAGLVVSGAMGVSGAAGCLIAALALPTVIRGLTWNPIHWIGVRSYSLYLTHDPIIVAIVFAFGLTATTWWSFPLGIIVSILVAAVFYKIVETPTLVLLRRIRRGGS